MIHALHDRATIRALLLSDPIWAAYALADLQPGWFENSRWFIDNLAHPTAIVLQYCGFQPNILLGVGPAAGLAPIVAHLPPGQYALSWPWSACHILAAYQPNLLPMYRMQWRHQVALTRHPQVSALGPEHAAQVQALIAPSFAAGEAIDGFDPAQMQAHTFRGVWVAGELIGVAGTHVVDPDHSSAAIGNVYVRPGFRGQGWGKALTAAVLLELQHRGLENIVLNVKQSNRAAIQVYTQLGFEIYCPFAEGEIVLSPDRIKRTALI